MTLMSTLFTKLKADLKVDMEAIFLYGAAGIGTTTPTISDTQLDSEVFRGAIDDVDQSQADSITVSLQIEPSEGNGFSMGEGGVFLEGRYPVDNCDTSDWSDSADMTTSLNNTTFYEGTGSLDITKDDTNTDTASTSKTTTSQDFTSKQFTIFIYIKDAAALAKLTATDALTIRFGSGAGDYYQWTKDAADLAVGWNVVTNLNSGNADSTTGTPVLAAMDYTYVALKATAAGITWSAGDFIMDDIRLVGGTMYIRNTLIPINKTDDIRLYYDFNVAMDITEG